MRKFLHTLFIILFLFPVLHAQVTTVPAVVTESGAVDIIFDATQGNKGLMGYTGDVYAHTGVITNLSTSGSDWKYAPAWGDNSAKYKLTSLGSDKWKLTISPDYVHGTGYLPANRSASWPLCFAAPTRPKRVKRPVVRIYLLH
jgi:hypothetical protein